MKQWRSTLVLIFIILFAAAIIGRLAFLQILEHDFYKALAKGQQQIFSKSQLRRSEIFLQDKEGKLYPLAINKNWPLVYVSPKEIKDEEKTAERLKEILALDKGFILEKLGSKKKLYNVVKNKLTAQEVSRLKKENLAGVYLQKEVIRYYPYEKFASQSIGFVGGEGKGQYGIEGYYDKMLEQAGPERENIVLNLDYNIQEMAENLLISWYDKLGFEQGQIIVAEPWSGKVLCLANFPNFDPNNYVKELDLGIFQNGACQKLFEPGSVFKPITMAAALQDEKISPETTYLDTGEVKIRGDTIKNYDERVWGERTMTEVLEKSINTGAVFVEQKIGHQAFLDYIEKFGFFEPTGIDLQGEVFSTNREFRKGYEINFATASFGQGIEITPMQLVRAFLAIANGGELRQPRLLGESAEVRRVISPKTASQLTAMLVSVVQNGFAKAAQIPGYYIAGKTGTAQIPWSALGINKRGYSTETVQTFVGFAPAFNPQFLVLIKLQEPATRTAEYSTVPIFRELAKYIIDYYQIAPDYE